jgi:hypothetical protein
MCFIINGHSFRLVEEPHPLYVCDHCHIAVEIRRKGDHEPMLASVPSCEEIRARRLERNPPEPEPVELEADAKRLGWTIEDAKHWWAAVREWRRAGKPTRTNAQVEAILRICAGDATTPKCEHYVNGRCRKCRCRVNTGKIPLFNKLRMATEGCPDGRFGPDC